MFQLKGDRGPPEGEGSRELNVFVRIKRPESRFEESFPLVLGALVQVLGPPVPSCHVQRLCSLR